MAWFALAITMCSSHPLTSFRFQHRISFMCVPYIILRLLPTGKIAATLFSRKPGFSLLPEGLVPLLRIGRSRDGSQARRFGLQLALQQTMGRLQKQALNPAIGFGGTRRQLSRDFLRLREKRIIVDHI